MAEITRTTATETQISNLNKLTFGATLTIPSGTKLTIKECTTIAHLVDGKPSKNAVGVFKCSFGDSEHIIYINSLIKKRFDYQGNPIPYKGSLNLEAAKQIGKTWADALTEFKKLEGKQIVAIETFYKGVDRNGDVRDILFNEFSFE